MATIVLCIMVAAVSAVLGYRLHARRVKSDLRTLRHFRRNCLRKQGWTMGIGSYDLESYDGGKNWYAVKRENGKSVRESDGTFSYDCEVKILGPAEEVYPGLLKQLAGMEALSEYARRNGPLTLAGSSRDEQMRLLTDAGFTVKGSN